MRKILTTLAVATALFAGQAMADQATVDSLQASGVPLSAEQNSAIASAEGQELVNAIADLVAAQPVFAGAIVGAAIRANPNLADEIVDAAIQAAPAQEQAIRDAARANQGGSPGTNQSGSIPTSSVPSVGGSGGGSTNLASPN